MWVPSMELGDDGAEAPRWSLEAATRFVDGKIADFFAALGALCARRPKKVLAVSVGAGQETNIQHDFNIHLFARFRHTLLIV